MARLILPYKRVFIIGLVIVAVALLYLYLYRSSGGRRLRAVMQNRDMASSLGVPARHVDATTFALGAGLAGMAGCALTLIGPIGPSLGTYYIVDAFMVVVLGGVGRLLGTILAPLAIGMVNTFLEISTSATVARCWCFCWSSRSCSGAGWPCQPADTIGGKAVKRTFGSSWRRWAVPRCAC